MNEYKALLNRLVQLIPEMEAAKMIVEFSGLSVERINLAGAPKTMWYRILTEANRHNDGVLNVIEAALEDFPNDATLLEEKNKLAPALPNPEVEAPPTNVDISTNPTINKKPLKILIENNKIKEVLELLNRQSSSFNSETQNGLILLNRRYKELQTQNLLGIIPPNEYSSKLSSISFTLLNFIDSI